MRFARLTAISLSIMVIGLISTFKTHSETQSDLSEPTPSHSLAPTMSSSMPPIISLHRSNASGERKLAEAETEDDWGHRGNSHGTRGGAHDWTHLWAHFTQRFGSDLHPHFSSNGKLIGIQGEVGKGASSSDQFQPDRTDQVTQRAAEILNEAEALFLTQEDWGLERHKIQTGQLSAQVYFNQTYQGLPIMPGGSVKIDLGSRGELLALESDYISNLRVTNHERLSQSEAFQLVRNEIQNEYSTALQTAESRKVVWTDGQIGKIAYQVTLSGTQFWVDADSGEILLRRARRHDQ